MPVLTLILMPAASVQAARAAALEHFGIPDTFTAEAGTGRACAIWDISQEALETVVSLTAQLGGKVVHPCPDPGAEAEAWNP